MPSFHLLLVDECLSGWHVGIEETMCVLFMLSFTYKGCKKELSSEWPHNGNRDALEKPVLLICPGI
jgi:hypothetical protein